jgi:hypothetical protein
MLTRTAWLYYESDRLLPRPLILDEMLEQLLKEAGHICIGRPTRRDTFSESFSGE